MDRCAVTNAQFAAFVAATGYVTVAERPLDPSDFPDAPPENLAPGSMVFTRTKGPVDLRYLSQWWTWTPGASWRHPEGRGSSAANRADHPVVHVAHEDAGAYAVWIGASLPTEAEWERAARGRHESAIYVWGDTREQPGERLANYWHGDFPWRADPATDRRSRSAHIRPTATDSTTWPATCGSGPTTGGHRSTATRAAAVFLAKRPERLRHSKAVTTRPSRSSGCREKSSKVDRSSAPTATAIVTAPRRGDRK
jgi:formylglycine-generating enzyme required for sulfatase activity